MFSALLHRINVAIPRTTVYPSILRNSAHIIPQFTREPITHSDTFQFVFGKQVRHRSNRSRRGLYNGKDIGTGNNVSFSKTKTRRTFKPNVILKRVYSETLDAMVRFHMTTSALRSIDKAGGLDNYLMKSNPTEGEGYKILKAIKKRMKNRAWFERKIASQAAVPKAEGKLLTTEAPLK